MVSLAKEMKAAAKRYWLEGFNVVAIKYEEGKGKVAKKPFSVWGKWHKQRQTLEEFESQGWDEANAFAIVTDYPNKDGLYLSVVDYDTKKVSEEAKAKGKQLLGKFPTTQMERTVSEGLHLVYLSRVKPKDVREFHKTHALELVAGGLLCVMAPSEGYVRLNDNPPTIVEDATALFCQILGVEDERAKVNEGFSSELLEKWVKQILDSGKLVLRSKGSRYWLFNCPFHPPDNNPSFALNLEKYYFVDFHTDEVFSVKQLTERLDVKLPGLEKKPSLWLGDYRFAVSDKDFMLYDKQGTCVFTCKLSFLNSGRNKRQIKEITGASEIEVERKIASFLEHVKAVREEGEEEHKEPSKLVLEALERQKAVRLHPLMDYHPQIGYSLGIFPLGGRKSLIFLAEKPFVSNSETIQIGEPQPILIHVKRLSWAKLHEDHAYILLQTAREFFEKGEIEFPAKNEVFSEVFGKILYYWWHSDVRYHVLVACWIIGTYFHRLFAFYPALNPQGQRQTGKTTLLDVITQSAWNPTGRETAVREADLFRTIEGTRGTYVLDITLLGKGKDTKDVIDVIETGTEAGGRVRRIHPKTGKPMEFETYGPKAIATRYELPFVAKCIRIITEQAPSPEYAKRRALIPFDKDWLHVKELLVKACIKYWREVKEAYESLEQSEKLCGRAFNYWAPLLAVCKVFAPEKFDGLLKLAEEDAEKAEKGDRLSEVEAAVLAVLSEEVKGEKEEQKTVSVLLKELTQKVQNIVPWVKDWHIVVSALENLGVTQRKYQTSKGVQYQISLEKVKRECEERKLKGEAEAETQANAIPPTEKEYISLDDLVSVYWKEEALTEKECGVCGYVKPTVWEARTTKGQTIAICEDCVREYQKRRENVDDA